jgi:hypothetical protein
MGLPGLETALCLSHRFTEDKQVCGTPFGASTTTEMGCASSSSRGASVIASLKDPCVRAHCDMRGGVVLHSHAQMS